MGKINVDNLRKAWIIFVVAVTGYYVVSGVIALCLLILFKIIEWRK